MNKLIPLLLLNLLFQISEGQNLVSNGSFEQFYCTPGHITSYRFCEWVKPPNNSGTPDGFRDFEPGNCSPCDCILGDHTFGGNTYARHGEFFVGGVAYYIQGGQSNARENIQTKLDQPLIEGHHYKIGFSVKLGSRSKYIINHFGMLISDTAYVTTNTYPLYSVIPTSPQLDLDGPLYDSTKWTDLSTTYTAAGGEQFVTFGNFTTDSALSITLNPLYNPTDTLCLLTRFGSYIFIDSVYIFDVTPAGVANINDEGITVYPNPVNDKLMLSLPCKEQNAELCIYSIEGKLFRKCEYQSSIDISLLKKGIYIIEIKTPEKVLRAKFMKK
jgi:hypothetical protein